MPILLLEPVEEIRVILDQSAKLAAETTDDVFYSAFVLQCRWVIDCRNLFLEIECANCCVHSTLPNAMCSAFEANLERWCKIYSARRTARKVSSAASADIGFMHQNPDFDKEFVDEFLDVMSATKHLQLIRPMDNVNIPSDLFFHSDPRIRHRIIVVAYHSRFPFWGKDCEDEMKKMIRGAYTDASSSLSAILDVYLDKERLDALSPAEAHELETQLMWYKCRLNVIAMFGGIFGKVKAMNLIEENSHFFSGEVRMLCPRLVSCLSLGCTAPNVVGIVSDLFSAFELAVLDMALLPTPEIFREAFALCQEGLRQPNATWRSHGEVLYTAFRSFQYSGGYISRHDGTAIAKEKVRVLAQCQRSEAFGRLSYTVATSLGDSLDHGAFDILVKLLYRLSLRLLENLPSAQEVELYGPDMAHRLLSERTHVVSNLIHHAFQNFAHHASVNPVFLLTYRPPGGDANATLVSIFAQLLQRDFVHSLFALDILHLCCEMNPRDAVHHIIDANIVPSGCDSILALFNSNTPAVPLNESGSISLAAMCHELFISFVLDSFSIHEAGKEVLRKCASSFLPLLLRCESDPFVYHKVLTKFPLEEIAKEQWEAFLDTFITQIEADTEYRAEKILFVLEVMKHFQTIDRGFRTRALATALARPHLPTNGAALQIENRIFHLSWRSYEPIIRSAIAALTGPAAIREYCTSTYFTLRSICDIMSERLFAGFVDDDGEVYDAERVREIRTGLHGTVVMMCETLLPIVDPQQGAGVLRHLNDEIDGPALSFLDKCIDEYLTLSSVLGNGTSKKPMPVFSLEDSIDSPASRRQTLSGMLRTCVGYNSPVGFLCVDRLLAHVEKTDVPPFVMWESMQLTFLLMASVARSITVRQDQIDDAVSRLADEGDEEKRGRKKGVKRRRKDACDESSEPLSALDRQVLESKCSESAQQIQRDLAQFQQVTNRIAPFLELSDNGKGYRQYDLFEFFISEGGVDVFQITEMAKAMRKDMRQSLMQTLFDTISTSVQAGRLTHIIFLQTLIYPLCRDVSCEEVCKLVQQCLVIANEIVTSSEGSTVVEGQLFANNETALVALLALTIPSLFDASVTQLGVRNRDKESKKKKARKETDPPPNDDASALLQEAQMKKSILVAIAPLVELCASRLSAQHTERKESIQMIEYYQSKEYRFSNLVRATTQLMVDVSTFLHAHSFSDFEELYRCALRICRHSNPDISVTNVFQRSESVLLELFRVGAEKIFKRVRVAPAVVPNHVTIDLTRFDRSFMAEYLKFSYALDFDVFMAEMRRHFADLVTTRNPVLLSYLKREVTLLRGERNNSERLFVVLKRPEHCAPEEGNVIAPETRVLEKAAAIKMLQTGIIASDALALAVAWKDLPWTPGTLRIYSNGNNMLIYQSQRAVLPFAEEILALVVEEIAQLLDLEEQLPEDSNDAPASEADDSEESKAARKLREKFHQSLVQFNQVFEGMVRVLNTAFASTYLRSSARCAEVLKRALLRMSLHPLRFVTGPPKCGGSTILFLVRSWTIGNFVSKAAAPQLLFDETGDPAVNDGVEDDDDDDDSEDDDFFGALGEEPSEEMEQRLLRELFQSRGLPFPRSLESPTAGQEGVPSTPQPAKKKNPTPFDEFVDIIAERCDVALPEDVPLASAAPPEGNPYYFEHPPSSIKENDELYFYSRDISLEDYIDLMLKILVGLPHEGSTLVYQNIAIACLGSTSLLARGVEAVWRYTTASASPEDEVRRQGKLPLLYNVILSLSTRFLSTCRRAAPTEGSAIISKCDEARRLHLLVSSLAYFSSRPTYTATKMIAVLLRLLCPTGPEPAPPLEISSWSAELSPGTYDLPFHEHSLEYVALGSGFAACHMCRGESYFYHYACRQCHSFSCCTGCWVQYLSDPANEFSVYDKKMSFRAIVRFAHPDAVMDLFHALVKCTLLSSFPSEKINILVSLVEDIILEVDCLEPPARRVECLERIADALSGVMSGFADNQKHYAQLHQKHGNIAATERNDTKIMNALFAIDVMHLECRAGFHAFHFIPIIFRVRNILTKVQDPSTRNGAHPLWTIQWVAVAQQVATTFIHHLDIASHLIAQLRSRDQIFSSSPSNVMPLAVLAKIFKHMTESEAQELLAHIESLTEGTEDNSFSKLSSPLLSKRETTSASFCLRRSETQLLVSETGASPSVIFAQAVKGNDDEVGKKRTDEDDACDQVPLAASSAQGIARLSELALRFRQVLNFYIDNTESPSIILDSGLGALIDTRHLDFSVREKLLGSRFTERLADIVDEEVEVNIIREELLDSSFDALAGLSMRLERGPVDIRVFMDDEEAVDEGGVTREWIALFFQALTTKSEHKLSNLFRLTGDGSTMEINPQKKMEPKEMRAAYQCVGVMIGLAMIQRVPIDAHFTRSLYKHLTNKEPSFADLEGTDPQVYRSLLHLNGMTSPEEFEALCQYFVVSEANGKDRELIPNGANVPVTNENKKQYIRLMAEYFMTTRVAKRLKQVLIGIGKWFPLQWLCDFTAEEMELVCCGLNDVDVEDWRGNTNYEGYSNSSAQVRWFWDVVSTMPTSEKAKLLQFVRGCSKVPASGFSALQPKFTIAATPMSDRLPSAHTCSNQLDLPMYSSPEMLREKLLRAVELGSVGFGFA